MSTTELILTILSSSVLSAMLTSYFNWRIHNANYKKDYYKKILDKRIDAYESLNTLTNRLSDIVYINNGVVHGLLCGGESFDYFITQLHLTMEKSYWLADETGHKLTELGTFLFNEITGYIDDTLPDEVIHQKYIELGIQHFDTISNFNKNLKKLVNDQLRNLHEVDKFFGDNGKDSTTYPLYDKKV